VKVIGVIPARFKSSRFPGKPLADICGKPMVWWTYNQAVKAKGIDKVYVATEDVRIKEVCEKYKIPCIMTSDEHRNGTERVAEVSEKTDGDIYITIQGDEPLIEPHNIEKIVNLMKSDDKIQCSTAKTPFKDPVDVVNGTTIKALSDLEGNLLFVTRSPVPYPKASLNYKIYKHMGLFGFRRETLQLFPKLSMGPLEEIEDLEVLRFIEHGIKMKVIETESGTISVDTVKDLNRVTEIIRSRR